MMHQKWKDSDGQLTGNIDEQTAVNIATRFLEQHYSIIICHASFQVDCWLVIARVGFLPEQIKKVIIDAKNGKILGCI